MTCNVYPPGADIGLHQSVIESIKLGSGFSVNYYHMGGGISATNPGYHIFMLFAGAFTGLPAYLLHAVVASIFSAAVVLCAFLIAKRFWSGSASLLAAFLVAFSAGDIEMLSWGGYPNIIALFLIAIILYFYLQASRFSKGFYLAVASLCVGAMFLTHVFSSFVFSAIIIVTLFLSILFSRTIHITRQQMVPWIAPIIIGSLLVSPYLLQIIPTYFGPEGAITGTTMEAKTALLETRVIPIEYAILSLIPAFLLLMFSKLNKKKWLTTTSLLFAVWILVPAILTQSYIFGVFLDYRRFLYFIFFPVIICLALLIGSTPKLFSRLRNYGAKFVHKNENENRPNGFKQSATIKLPGRVTYSILVIGLLLLSLFCLPILTPPNKGLEESSYYQVMTPLRYEAINWIKNNTPPNAVFVSDAEYGWWISGFAQRPTLSAVSPQYLILAHEFEPAEIARNLLNSKYFIDNGILQVNYNEATNKESELEISARLFNSYFLYPFFAIKNSNVSLLFRNNGTAQHLSFTDFPATNMQVKNGSDWASITITREDKQTIFTESVTIYAGVTFSKITITLSNKVQNINYDWLHIPITTKGAPIQCANNIAFADGSVQALSQLIFPEEQLGTAVTLRENPDYFELSTNLGGKTTAKIEFFAGLSAYLSSETNQSEYLKRLILQNSETYLGKTSELPLSFFDYQDAVKVWNVSYVVITSAESIPRFIDDSFFSTVYKNDEVAIFRVNASSK